MKAIRSAHPSGTCGCANGLKMLREYSQDESDLVERDRVFYLIATCEVPEEKRYGPVGFSGVDLSIVTTLTDYQVAGPDPNRHRKCHGDLRK